MRKKKLVFVLVGFVLGSFLFLMTSRASMDREGCSFYDDWASYDCHVPIERGFPLVYKTDDKLSIGSLLVDLGMWVAVGGVVAGGTYMIWPKKK
jgi:hypothetical protein